MAYTTIDNPELFFQCKAYTGNGTAIGSGGLAVTLDGSENMQPDFVWLKRRTDAGYHHNLFDSVRGATQLVYANLAEAAGTKTEGVTSFNSDGFTVGNDGDCNASGKSHVAWCWKESATAGFDIISMTGTGSARTQSHNLSAVPKMVIVKCLNDGNKSRAVYHAGAASDAETDVLALDAGDAKADDATYWNDTAPTSSVFTVGTANGVNKDTKSYISYVFADVQGYSRHGTYKGNSNSDGTFIFTGFSPAFIMIKCTSNASTDWLIADNQRSYNKNSSYNNWMLRANTTAAEENGTVGCDFLSNGFKWRDSENSANVTGRTYIYMAFAHSPFVNSNGVPNNAVATTGGR